MHRQGIHDLIGHQDAGEGPREAVDPVDSVDQVRMASLEQGPLALAQGGTRFQDEIKVRRTLPGLEAIQDIRRQFPRPGAQFQDVATSTDRQDLAALVGQAMAEEGRDGGGGDKVPPRPEGRRPRHVIAEAWRIEGKFHEAVEGQGTAPGCGLGADQVGETTAVRPGGLVIPGLLRAGSGGSQGGEGLGGHRRGSGSG